MRRTRADAQAEGPPVDGSPKVVHVTAESRTRLLGALSNAPSPYTSLKSHCVASSAAFFSLLSPLHIAEILDFHTSPSAPGVCLITGLPTDPILPPTPIDGNGTPDKQTFVSEGCLLGIAQLLGMPFGFASEKNGATIHNVCPVRDAETEQSNGSSRIDLSLHVENAYFDERPDYLALYCLRQDPSKQARTSYADARCALAELDPDDVAQLQRPVYSVPSPPSHHRGMGGEQWSGLRPAIQSREAPDVICHFPGMRAQDQRAQRALDNFERALSQPHVLRHAALQPGSLLLINNRKAVHGRTSFRALYDGNDRWLQRVYIRARNG
ncbi:Clavaminate synthase-like protein [Polychaeton citri CBS 116435]|uniref:Clavaminate synthase-like protein n=1 Tax=Polychaeton citri CBS 116435 TaxID=1314669 RepID=A0A9P4Q3N7_9PEZI|nr:Clavaminate synthase-like protein [Polychaeton citri CBS 116435]